MSAGQSRGPRPQFFAAGVDCNPVCIAPRFRKRPKTFMMQLAVFSHALPALFAISVIGCKALFPLAGSASPIAAPVNHEVLTLKRVPLWATGACGGGRGNGTATQCVLPATNRTYVEGITTPRVVAHKMIEFRAGGDRPHFPLVANTMHHSNRARRSVPSPSVSGPSARSLPNIATVRIGDPADLCGRATFRQRVERNEVACHFVAPFRLRYARMRFAPRSRRQVEHLPSGSRFFGVSRCPTAQYLCFMPLIVTHSRVTHNPYTRVFYG